MTMTRKEFLDLAGRGAVGVAALSSFDLLHPAHAREATEVLDTPEVKRVRDHVEQNREAHLGLVQRDLRQPSISSWKRGVREMAELMVDSFRKLGCKEVQLVPTTLPEWPGILAHYDVGAPKTVVVYMMYDTQPFVEARWSSPPLEARRVRDFAGFPECVVARGAINSKGPNRFVLNALESIVAVHGRLPVNVIFTCDGAEEQGSPTSTRSWTLGASASRRPTPCSSSTHPRRRTGRWRSCSATRASCRWS
jgi:hypothetical protein